MEDDMAEDERIQRLYEVDREDFVAARTALAKEVGTQDKALAKRIKALRKPTVAAWAMNRVAQQRSDEVERLLQAGRAVREAQEQAMQGDAAALRGRVDDRRAVIRSLADEAVGLAGETHRDDIDATLEAASVDPEVGELLRRGRLTTPHPRPSGFGLVAGMDLGGGDAGSSGGDDDERAEQARAERERLEGELEEANGAVERGQAELDEAESALSAAERRVAEARAAVERYVNTREALRAQLAATAGSDAPSR